MADYGQDIGATLREARMRARIDIGEVELRTKIRAKYLRAIENEEWDLLPGPIYVKSFLRTYAEYLGLDARYLLDEYRRRYELTEAPARPLSAVRRERERERARAVRGPRAPALPSWAWIGLVLVAAAVGLYLIGRGGKPTPSPHAAVRRPTVTRPAAPVRHRPTPVRHRVTGTLASVKLVPTGDVWICVVDGHGRMLIPGVVFHAGQTVPAVSGAKLLVNLGNANVRATIDHHAYPVSGPASIGLTVRPGGATPLHPGPTCGQ